MTQAGTRSSRRRRAAFGLRRARTALLLSAIPGILGLFLARWPTAAGLESGGLDWLFLLRGPKPAPSGVCVVAIDDDSYSERGLDPTAPWPRALHADLIRTLEREGARAVAFDVLFLEEGDPEQDAALEAALAATKIVVLGATMDVVQDPRFEQARLLEPYEPFARAAARVAEVNLPTDRDGVIRYAWTEREGRPGLAAAAYEVATGDTSRRLPSPRLLDYYGPPRSIPTVSLYQALEPDVYLPPGFFRGKVVFVGLSQNAAAGPAAKDAFLTPYRGGMGAMTFGVEIHATLAANLLEDRRIRLLPPILEAGLIFLLPLVSSLVFMFLGPLAGGAAFLVLLAAPWGAGYLAFTRAGLWIPVVIPAAVQLPASYGLSLIWYYLTTRREREKVKRAFAFYLAPEMIRQIAENPDALNLGGEEIVGTAMFTDIAGFTSLAETLTAPQTAQMLNEYFSEVTQHIFDSGGTLIKFIGDAVFAIWGAPIRREDHATRACIAALELASRQAPGPGGETGRRMVTRIGVHTGPMLVGNLGSRQRFDYTAIGDAVNVASRLEGLNKPFGTFALVSDEALRATDGRFRARPLGRVRVAGRREPIAIHQLLGLRGLETPEEAKARALFEEALEAFCARRFAEAASRFLEALGLAGGTDGPARFYATLAARYAAEPPAPDWDGVIAFEKS